MNNESTIVFEGHDQYGSLLVVDSNGERTLRFGQEAVQSKMSLENPTKLLLEYTRLMTMALLFNSKPQNVLFMGVGGASIPKFIHKYFPECHLHLVDRSPLIPDLCRNYFDFPKSERLHTHMDDVYNFIKTTESKYDLIFMDLSDIPTVESNLDFFELCKQRLKDKDSIFIWNTWQTTPKKLIKDCLQRASQSFGKNMIVLPGQTELNNIFLMFNREMKKTNLTELLQKASDLETLTHQAFPQMLADLNNLKGLEFFSR